MCRAGHAGFSSTFSLFKIKFKGGVDRAEFIAQVEPVLQTQLTSSWNLGRVGLACSRGPWG